MKGVIIDCLKNLVSSKFGTEQWQNICVKAGLKPNEIFLATLDFEDKVSINLINSTCTVLNLSMDSAATAFGEHWMNFYASKMYSGYISNVKSSKELLLKLDSIHTMVTQNIQNSRPPKFTYEWKDDKTLIMNYNSQRNLIDLFIGLAKGVGKYYKENLVVKKISNTKVEIIFN